MRKWRPAHKCIYVIPEIKGNIKSLEIILNRILPLRFSIGQEDILIFLGDYFDGSYSKNVIDILINLKKENENVFFIKGDREELFCRSLKSEANFTYWKNSGGKETIQSYINNDKIKAEDITFGRFCDFFDKTHINFILSLPNYIEMEGYVFLHSGFNSLPLSKQTETDFFFTNELSKNIKQAIKNNENIKFDNVYVISDNYKSNTIFVSPKCLMLSSGAPNKLTIFELNSMKCSIIKNGKERFYKHEFKYYE